MATLTREQRKLLENTVVAARDAAERGAEKILTSLGAGNRDAPGKLSPEDTALRNQLRAHGRQLGDKRHPNGSQETTHLKQACAYEHWHRLLFARFLAENDLLMNPEYGVAMSLSEIQEMARAQNQDWLNLASDYARRMLLEVFRPDDPVLQVVMPPENRQELEEKLAQLPTEIFIAEDSLGWVYQFWQRNAKTNVNQSEVKIGANELAPVTQLFTEDYMVLFLLENTLGAWWTARHGSTALLGYNWTYLRLKEDGTPAAGTFDGWPKTARELRILDPCMGSGHFLSFALPILARMRADEERLPIADATFAALKENLFGLELDPRCSQIAAFNLALTAWRLCGHHFELPPLNLACSGLAVNSREEEWAALAQNAPLAEETLRRLFKLFSDAPVLGSLIDPHKLGDSLFVAEFAEVRSMFEKALKSQESTDELRELAIAASGVLAAARTLSSSFTLVCTNVPYLGREGHCETLSDFADNYAPDAAADLATLMFHRCLGFLEKGCSFALVLPQNWWVGTTYATFRKRILQDATFRFAVVLGEEAWWTFGNRGPNTVLMIGDLASPDDQHSFLAIDVSSKPGSPVIGLESKSEMLRGEQAPELRNQNSMIRVQQSQLAKSKGARISVGATQSGAKLSQIASSGEGCSTGDGDRFLRRFWEVDPGDGWLTYCGPGYADWDHCDSSLMVHWENGKGELAKSPQARMQNSQLWTRRGVLVGRVRGITATLFNGGCFSKGAVLVCPHEEADLSSVFAFLRSSQYEQYVRTIDPRVSAATSIVTDVPFDLSKWRSIASERFPEGLPGPDHCNPSQSTFDGQLSRSKFPLQVAVARLVGYRWPRQAGWSFPDCPALEKDALESHPDGDGIVCLSSLSGNAPAAERLRGLLSDAFGSEWSASKLAELLGRSDSLELWLRDQFFVEHCNLFHSRPFVWHIWDGRKDGFHALVNYHKLTAPNYEGRKVLEKLIYTSLGDWISRQRAEVASGADGAEARLSAALQLQSELENILRGEPPYDIFVRWKPIHEQAIGWEPDLNDGVRLNMRPWLVARPYQPSKKDACLLRIAPLKFPLGTDKGKERDHSNTDFPWFAKTPDRNNDVHLTLDEKRKARDRQKA